MLNSYDISFTAEVNRVVILCFTLYDRQGLILNKITNKFLSTLTSKNGSCSLATNVRPSHFNVLYYNPTDCNLYEAKSEIKLTNIECNNIKSLVCLNFIFFANSTIDLLIGSINNRVIATSIKSKRCDINGVKLNRICKTIPATNEPLLNNNKKYSYKFVILNSSFNRFQYNEVFTNYLKILRFDGTIQENDDALVVNRIYAKPFKLTFTLNSKGSTSKYNFWFDEKEITRVFERFYGAHPETMTDFIIRIDAENKKYELALYRQGLKEPVVIPESAYQLIVFKNKFEDYRSENYNQPRGAWIW